MIIFIIFSEILNFYTKNTQNLLVIVLWIKTIYKL